ncbi:hypothetical protein F5B20DRAFT_575674 [Whalleya microplaca]|nr:hypothetical protein F5B20DRAFT_575674 [Whalleya microplaca]
MAAPAPQQQRPVLMIGLTFNIPLPPWVLEAFGDGPQIEAGVKADVARAEAAGFPITPLLVDPQDVEPGLRAFEAQLRSGVFRAVLIGAGVRILPEYSVLFEKLVDLSRTIVPDVPILFPAAPGTTGEALGRVFGITV